MSIRNVFCVGERFCFCSLLVIALFGAGCLPSVLATGDAPARLALSPALPAPVAVKAAGKQLVVALPVSGGEFDTDRIALIFDQREVRYLAGARWTDNAPLLLRRLITGAIEAAGGAQGVDDDLAGFAADARLLTDLRKFALSYTTGQSTPVAVFEAKFSLMNVETGRVVDALIVRERAAATGESRDELALAMEQVVQQGLHKLASWVVETLNIWKR